VCSVKELLGLMLRFRPTKKEKLLGSKIRRKRASDKEITSS
jgi:hypothetical protein